MNETTTIEAKKSRKSGTTLMAIVIIGGVEMPAYIDKTGNDGGIRHVQIDGSIYTLDPEIVEMIIVSGQGPKSSLSNAGITVKITTNQGDKIRKCHRRDTEHEKVRAASNEVRAAQEAEQQQVNEEEAAKARQEGLLAAYKMVERFREEEEARNNQPPPELPPCEVHAIQLGIKLVPAIIVLSGSMSLEDQPDSCFLHLAPGKLAYRATQLPVLSDIDLEVISQVIVTVPEHLECLHPDLRARAEAVGRSEFAKRMGDSMSIGLMEEITFRVSECRRAARNQSLDTIPALITLKEDTVPNGSRVFWVEVKPGLKAAGSVDLPPTGMIERIMVTNQNLANLLHTDLRRLAAVQGGSGFRAAQGIALNETELVKLASLWMSGKVQPNVAAA